MFLSQKLTNAAGTMPPIAGFVFMKCKLTDFEKDRIIEMAWEDRTPFDAIESQFGLSEKEVINIMRKEMKGSSFKMWRKRVQGRKTKHIKQRDTSTLRFKSSRQKNISFNKISKRS